MDLGLREVRTADQLKMEFTGRLHAVDFKLLKRALHPRDRFARDSPANYFAQERVIEGRHDIAGENMAIHTHADAARRGIPLDLAGLGLEILFRVFGIDAALDRVTVQPDVSLKQLDALPDAMRICALTRSMPQTISVTGCSTWIRVFISMK